MKPEEIKVGDTYNVRMTVTDKTDKFIYTETGVKGIIDGYCFANQESFAFSPLSDPANVTKNAQKYDPCRKFKERDKVRYCAPDGRIYADRGSLREHIKNRDFTHVVRDEQENGKVGVYDPFDEENPYYVPAHALELVSPVEELERYVIIHNDYEKYYEVCWKDDDEPDGRTGRTRCRTTFWYHNPPKTHTQEHAKAAAEAERDRLNAEFAQRINETTKTQTTDNE